MFPKTYFTSFTKMNEMYPKTICDHLLIKFMKMNLMYTIKSHLNYNLKKKDFLFYVFLS